MKILMENCSKNEAKWLEMRKGYIGASEAYDAADIDDDSRPLRPWLKLRGEEEEFVGNDSTYFGKQLENFVADEFCRQYVVDHPGTDIKLVAPDIMVRHPTLEFASATFDRFVYINGELCLLELKTTKAQFAEAWADNSVPKRYRVQVLHQLACLEDERVSRGFAACFIMEPSFVYREIPNDPAIVQEILSREKTLFEMAKAGVVPALKTPTPYELRALFWKGDGALVEMPPDLEVLCSQYRVAMKNFEAAEAKKKKLSALITQSCGGIGKAEGSQYNCTMVRTEYEELDVKALKEGAPDVHDALLKTYKRNIKKFYPLVKERKEK